MQFNVNVNEYNLNGQTTEGSAVVMPSGWHKLILKSFGEETMERNGEARGALFVFEAADGDEYVGAQFRKWFCTQAIEAKAKWRQTQFENIIIRIAQCVGLTQLTSVEQLINKPFYAYLVTSEREYQSNETNRNGEFITKKTTDINFNRGLLTEQIVSCQEYADLQKPAVLEDEPF